MKKVLTLFLFGINLLTQAQIKDPKRQFELGYQHLQGTFRSYDPPKALELFRHSAAAGYSRAMNAIGNMYFKGLGVKMNIDSAIYWYEIAAHHGYTDAWLNAGRLYQEGKLVQQDFVKAAQYFQAGADAGNNNCLNMIAYFHYKGLGLTQDYTKAFNIYRLLAEKGHRNAQYFLGICYRNGYGTSANNQLAKEWLMKAASRNEGQARHELFEESLPENRSVVSMELEKRVDELKRHREQFETSNTNDLSGNYRGFAVYYDFSGNHVNNVAPLSLKMIRNGNGYKAIWKEGDSLRADLNIELANNRVTFDSASKYTRNNYYSNRTDELVLFNNAALDLKYLNDSIYLSGEVRFYSMKRREPMQPMYIALSRGMDESRGDYGNFRFGLFPNPATTSLSVNFTIDETTGIILELYSLNGKLIERKPAQRLPAGSYKIDFNVQQLPPGSYIIRASKTTGKRLSNSQQFIKI